METSLQRIGKDLRAHAIILGSFILLFWVLEIIDWLLPGFSTLDSLGVRPRTIQGLRGILFGPFLHGGFSHVLANTIPFIVLGWFIMIRSLKDFAFVSLITALISGLGIWLIAPANTVHIGASGLVFGYFGYLLLRAYFERSFSSILISIIVVMLYGGLIFGVLPQGQGISWQAHLFGFIGGGYAAYLMSPRRLTAPLSSGIISESAEETAVSLEDSIQILE